jgi:hypothetical protein
MSWDRSISLYLDVDAVGAPNALLDRKTSSPRGDTPSLIEADKLIVKLFLRQKSDTLGGASTAVQLAALDTIVLAAKETADLVSGSVLFSADTFVLSGTGDDACYMATLDLNTADLATALGSADSLVVTVDVEIADQTVTYRNTLRFSLTVLRQVYDSVPASLDPGEPNYYTAAQIDAMLAARLNLASGMRIVVDAAGNITVEEIT